MPNETTTPWRWGRDGVLLALAMAYVLLLTVQINLPPLERYPGWDYFWGDTLQAGKLYALKHALRSFELPAINPYTGLGWNSAGDTTSVEHFVCPFNLLILFFHPAIVLAVRTAVIMMIGAAGAFLYLRRVTGNRLISFLGSISYVSLPLGTGMIYHATVSSSYYFVPVFLLLIHRILEQGALKRILLFVAVSLLALSSSDIYALVMFPPAIGVYAFLIAWGYYRFGFLNAFKWAFALVFLNILAGSFYIIPLDNNLRAVSAAMQELGLRTSASMAIVSLQGIQQFLAFFRQYCLETLYKPLEGSGLLLYVPVFFHIAILLSLIFWRLVFRNNARQALIPLALVALGGLMFIISVVFYAFPAISSAGHGTLRYHINLFPFVILLAGFICFSVINRLPEFRFEFYALIMIGALILDLMIFAGPRPAVSDTDPVARWFYLQPFARQGVVCANLVSVRYLADMQLALPWLNLALIALLLAGGIVPNIKRALPRTISSIVFMVSALFLTLLMISVHHELRATQQSGWQLILRGSYHYEGYLKRKVGIDRLIDRYNPNYRTLPASADVFKMKRGRNWKLVAETELNIQDREKILFSYRETMHPYTGRLYSMFNPEGGIVLSNWFPPLAELVAGNMDIVRFMGVRWILSADGTINHPDLIHRGEWVADKCPFYETAADGTVYVYELRNPLGIAFLADKHEVAELPKIKRRIFSNKEFPWNEGVVLLEEPPSARGASANTTASEGLTVTNSQATIVKETFNSIAISVQAPSQKYLVLSYIFRPGWKAFLGSEELKIYRAYGGFMCVPIQPGQTTVVFKYTPWDVYAGLFGSMLAFILPFSFGWWQRRRSRLGPFPQRWRIGMWLGGMIVVAATGYWMIERIYPESWEKRGEALVGAGHYSAASDCFLKALAKGRQSAVVYRRLSECFEALEQWEHAIDYSLSWTRLEPDNSQAWLTLGQSSYGAERYNLAAGAFAKANRLQPDCAESCKGWAMSEYARRKYAAALPPLRRWIQLAPDDGDAQRLMGLILARVGHDVSGSVSHLTAAIPNRQLKRADRMECLAMLGVGESSLGNLAKGQRYFEQAEQLDPDWTRVLTVEEQRTAQKAIAFGIDATKRKAMASVLFSLNQSNVASLISYAESQIPEIAGGEASPAASLAWAPDSPAALVALCQVRRYRLSLPSSSVNLTAGTFSVWARLADTSKAYSTLLAVNDTTPLYVYRCGKDGTLMFKYNGNSRTYTPPSAAILGITNWHHYAVTWADGEQRLMIDGVLACSLNERATTARTDRVCAGWNGIDDNEQWDGPMWNFTTFSRALETREIAALIRADIQDAVIAADAAWNVGEYGKAIDIYQRAADFHRASPDLNHKMATYYDRIGQRTEAVRWYEQWAFGARDNIEGMATLGAVYLGIKNYPMAASTFERLLKIEPGNMAFIRGAGIGAFGAGAYNQAVDLFMILAMRESTNFAANLLAEKALERSTNLGVSSPDGTAIAMPGVYLQQAGSLADRRFVLDFTSLSCSNDEFRVITREGWLISISGPVTLTNLPGQTSCAIRIQDTPQATRIYGPAEAVDLRQGTISVWARLQDPSKQYADIVAAYSASGSRNLYLYRTSDGRIKMRYNENTAELASRSGVVTDGNWHHYAITWRDGEQAVYVDGERVLSGYARSPAGKTSRLAIGWLGDGDTEQWNGWLAEFSVFGKVLAEEDVAALTLADAASYQQVVSARDP